MYYLLDDSNEKISIIKNRKAKISFDLRHFSYTPTTGICSNILKCNSIRNNSWSFTLYTKTFYTTNGKSMVN